MNKDNPHIYFRADASSDIGYGHFVRTLALADMLRDKFRMTFVTRQPTPYQIEQIKAVCDDYVAIGEDHFEAFLKLIQPGDIVVLDNYFFDTAYQREIKAKGCKLVCIDDMHDKHYVADMVINHGLNSPELFSVEPYTLLCLGLDWALLRQPFLTAQPLSVREKGHIVVSFGGSDPHNLTYKVCRLLADKPEIRHITAVVGDVYDKTDSLQGFDQVEVCKNLAAEEMADLFCRVEFAVLPASTICIEALVCDCPVAAGYYTDNQAEFYHEIVKSGRIRGLGNLLKSNWVDLSLGCFAAASHSRHDSGNYEGVFLNLAHDNFSRGKYTFINYIDLTEAQNRSVYEARNDISVRKWMTNDQEFRYDEHLSFVSTLAASRNKKYWAVFIKDIYVGSVYINPYDADRQNGEWGLFLAPSFIGTGIGLDIEFFFLDYLFKSSGLREIHASIKKNNIETYHLQRRFSFEQFDEDETYYYLRCDRQSWIKEPQTLKEFKRKVFQI